MTNSISILGCGWLGLPLGKFLAKNSVKIKGSTTHAEKLKAIRKAGMLPFQLNMNGSGEKKGNFFQSDVLVITIPTSVEAYRRIIDNIIGAIEASAIKKVVFISSTAIYPNLNRIVTESDADKLARTRSGIPLLEIEDLFRYNEKFRATIIRFSGLYGPKREPGRFLAGRDGVKGAHAPVNLIHMDDCIRIIDSIIKKDIWGETFNACAPSHPAKMEFYTKACLALGMPPPNFVDEDPSFKIISSEKLIKALDYKFQHPDPMRDISLRKDGSQ